MVLDVNEYKLPGDLALYRTGLRQFIADEGEALSREIEENNRLPADLWPLFRKAGLFRLTIPVQYGGLGLTPTEYATLLEEIAHSHGSIRLLVHVWNWIATQGFVRYGAEEQRKEYLPPMAQGEGLVAFALTEPNSGTGTDIQTEARRENNVYILNGEKHLISLSDVARAVLVVAYTDRSQHSNGITMFVVEKHVHGFKVIPQPDAMGMRGSFHGKLRFHDVRIPARQVLGEEGRGLEIALDLLDLSRAFIAISCVGLAQELLDRSIKYSSKRITFGKPIAERQAVQGMLADMATQISAARALTMDVVRRGEAGEDIRADAAKSKLFGLQMVGHVSDRALEVHGGVGYLKGMSIERYYRDARALWFEEGSPTIQRMVIARKLLSGGA